MENNIPNNRDYDNNSKYQHQNDNEKDILNMNTSDLSDQKNGIIKKIQF